MNIVAKINSLIWVSLIGVVLLFITVAGVVNYQENQKYWGTNDAQRDAVREYTYKAVCREWMKGNLWERYVINRGQTWCSDYLNRL